MPRPQLDLPYTIAAYGDRHNTLRSIGEQQARDARIDLAAGNCVMRAGFAYPLEQISDALTIQDALHVGGLEKLVRQPNNYVGPYYAKGQYRQYAIGIWAPAGMYYDA